MGNIAKASRLSAAVGSIVRCPSQPLDMYNNVAFCLQISCPNQGSDKKTGAHWALQNGLYVREDGSIPAITEDVTCTGAVAGPGKPSVRDQSAESPAAKRKAPKPSAPKASRAQRATVSKAAPATKAQVLSISSGHHF